MIFAKDLTNVVFESYLKHGSPTFETCVSKVHAVRLPMHLVRWKHSCTTAQCLTLILSDLNDAIKKLTSGGVSNFRCTFPRVQDCVQEQMLSHRQSHRHRVWVEKLSLPGRNHLVVILVESLQSATKDMSWSLKQLQPCRRGSGLNENTKLAFSEEWQNFPLNFPRSCRQSMKSTQN